MTDSGRIDSESFDSQSAAGPASVPRIFGDMVVTARPLAEYCAMFDLGDGAIEGRVLDCAGGASSFTAEVNAGGGSAVACDPTYGLPAPDLLEHVVAGTRRGNDYVREHHGEYVWSYYRDPDDHLAQRLHAAELFGADFVRFGAERYVAAPLPTLPFDDRSFDRALCSHLLFTYADRLPVDFHLDAVRELARVAEEVRLFPVMPIGSFRYPHLDDLRAELTACGIETELRDVPYEFQRGANRMLVCAGGRKLA